MIFSVVLGTAASIAIARSGSAWVNACDLQFMSPPLLPALPFGFAALVYINQLRTVGKTARSSRRAHADCRSDGMLPFAHPCEALV